MKRILVLALVLLTGFSTFCTIKQIAAAPAVVEYNLAGCKSRGFGVYHVEVSGDKISFTWHLTGPGTIEKYGPEDGITLDFKSEPVDKNGDSKYHAQTKSEGHLLELNGVVHGKYIIGVALSDGELSTAFYGKEGTVDEMSKEHTGPADDVDYKYCLDLQGHSASEVPGQLQNWLHDQITDKGGSSASR